MRIRLPVEILGYDYTIRLALSIYLVRLAKGKRTLPAGVRKLLTQWAAAKIAESRRTAAELADAANIKPTLKLDKLVKYRRPRVYRK